MIWIGNVSQRHVFFKSGTAILEGATDFGKWVYLEELDYYGSVLKIVSSPHSLCLLFPV